MFMEIHHEVEVWLEKMDETISRLSPVSEDSEKAKAQLANTKVQDNNKLYHRKLPFSPFVLSASLSTDSNAKVSFYNIMTSNTRN